jgi:hypothetical protein
MLKTAIIFQQKFKVSNEAILMCWNDQPLWMCEKFCVQYFTEVLFLVHSKVPGMNTPL